MMDRLLISFFSCLSYLTENFIVFAFRGLTTTNKLLNFLPLTQSLSHTLSHSFSHSHSHIRQCLCSLPLQRVPKYQIIVCNAYNFELQIQKNYCNPQQNLIFNCMFQVRRYVGERALLSTRGGRGGGGARGGGRLDR